LPSRSIWTSGSVHRLDPGALNFHPSDSALQRHWFTVLFGGTSFRPSISSSGFVHLS
jgi:hypothetical protein